MALSKSEIRDGYPLPAYNYRVSLDGEAMAFSEVTGLRQEYESVVYRHGLSHWSGPAIIPGMAQVVEITLKRGLVRRGSALGDWIDGIYRNPLRLGSCCDLVIDLCDESGAPVVSWTVSGALAVALEAPGLDASANDVAVETLRLKARSVRVKFHD